MPKPNKPTKLLAVGLDRMLQPDEWPEDKRQIIGTCLARMIMRRKEANDQLAETDQASCSTSQP